MGNSRIVGPWTESVNRFSSDRYVRHWEENFRSLLYQNEKAESLLLFDEKIRWADRVLNEKEWSIHDHLDSRILFQWPSETELAVSVVLDNQNVFRYSIQRDEWDRFFIPSVRNDCYGGDVLQDIAVKKVENVLYFAGGKVDHLGKTLFCGMNISDGELVVRESFPYDGVIQNIGLEEHIDDGKLIIFFGNSRLIDDAICFHSKTKEFSPCKFTHDLSQSSISVRDSIFVPLSHQIFALSMSGFLYEMDLLEMVVTFKKYLGKSKLFPVSHSLIYAQLSVDSIRIQWEDLDRDSKHVYFNERPAKPVSLNDFEILHHPKADVILLKKSGDTEREEKLHSYGFFQDEGKIFSLNSASSLSWNNGFFVPRNGIDNVPDHMGIVESYGGEIIVFDGKDLWKCNSDTCNQEEINLEQVENLAGCVIGDKLHIVGNIGDSMNHVVIDLQTFDSGTSDLVIAPTMEMSLVNFHGHPILLGGRSSVLSPYVYNVTSGSTLFDLFIGANGYTSAVVVDHKIFAINGAGFHELNLGGGSLSYIQTPFRKFSHKFFSLMDSFSRKLFYLNDKLLFFGSDDDDTYVYESMISSPSDWTPLITDQYSDETYVLVFGNRVYGIDQHTLMYFDISKQINSSMVVPDHFHSRVKAAICSCPERSSIFVYGGMNAGTHLNDILEYNVESGAWKEFETGEMFSLISPSMVYMDGNLYILGKNAEQGYLVTYSIETQTYNSITTHSDMALPAAMIARNNTIIFSGSNAKLDYVEFSNNTWKILSTGGGSESSKTVLFSYNGLLHGFKSGQEGNLFIWNDVDNEWVDTMIPFPEISWTQPMVRGHTLFAYPYAIDLKTYHFTVLDPTAISLPNNDDTRLLKYQRKVYLFSPGFRIWDYDLDSMQWGFSILNSSLPSSPIVVRHKESSAFIMSNETSFEWAIGTRHVKTHAFGPVLFAFAVSQDSFYFGNSNHQLFKFDGNITSIDGNITSIDSFYTWNGIIMRSVDKQVSVCTVPIPFECHDVFWMNHFVRGIFRHGNQTIGMTIPGSEQLRFQSEDETFDLTVKLTQVHHIVQIDDHSIMGIGKYDEEVKVFFYNAETQKLFYPSTSRWTENLDLSFGLWEERPIAGSVTYHCCFGFSSNDEAQCSGHGICVGQDVCECETDWIGETCDEPAP